MLCVSLVYSSFKNHLLLSPVCIDGGDVLVNGQTCTAAISANPQFCYQENVREACCLSCLSRDTGVDGQWKHFDEYLICLVYLKH